MSNHQADRQHLVIRVLVVDDQKMMQELMKDYLGIADDIEIVAVASDGRDGVQQALALNPDVVLMDIEMPEMDGIAATQMLRNRNSSAKILVVSSSYDDRYLAQSLRHGAMGYLLKTATPEELVMAIRGVHSGNLQFGSGILQQKLSSMAPGSKAITSRPSQSRTQGSAQKRSSTSSRTPISRDSNRSNQTAQPSPSKNSQPSSRHTIRSANSRQHPPTVTIDVGAAPTESRQQVNNSDRRENVTIQNLAIELAQIRAGYWVLRTEIQAQRRWLNRLSVGLAISVAVSCLFAFF
ncbi:MAG: response regulator transcription factor [Synechococcus sp.]